MLNFYKDCSKSNAFYFIMLAHNIRGRRWWYGSRGWSFLPISHYFLSPFDRWQPRGSMTKRHLTQECGWSKSVKLDSSMRKKFPQWHSLILAESFWRSNSGCNHSEAVDSMFQRWNSNSGSLPLVLIFRSMACLLIAGKNAQLMVDTVEKQCFVTENLHYQTLLLLSVYRWYFPRK